MKELSRLCRKLERVTGRRLVVLRYNPLSFYRYGVVDLTHNMPVRHLAFCNTLADCKRVVLDQFL